MSYCKYHPLQAANYTCPQCVMSLCKGCSDEGRNGKSPRCLLCGNEIKSLGVTADADPFWRRIDKAFRYPLSTEVLVMIGVVSLVTAISSFLPLPLMAGIGLLCTAVIVKYCFNCLSATAMGKMTTPGIATAYEGGVTLVFRLMLAVVLMTALVGFIYVKVSPALASFLGFLIVIGLPAMIIVYAMTENMLEALNPLKLVSLVASIGLPYGLILAILMIMMGSVELLSEVIGYQQSVVTLTLQSAVSNFYSVVMFHLMGYMIFQYQHRLGYTAEVTQAEVQELRPEQERINAKIQVMIKEGYWGSAENEFRESLKRFGDDEALNTNFFLFTLSVLPDNVEEGARQEAAAKVIDNYFRYLIRTKQQDKLNLYYKRACLALRGYQPKRPELRYELAKACFQNGTPKIAVKLLNGLHRAYPRFLHLIPVYVEAHLILNLPEQAGLSGRIDGEYLQGGIGELQVFGLIRVMIAEADYDAGKEIITQWDSA